MTDTIHNFPGSPLEVAVDRRTALAGGLALGGALFAAGEAHSTFITPDGLSLKGDLYDLTTAAGNVDAYAKITSNLDMKSTHYGWLDGYVMGVAPGGAIKTFAGFRGLGTTRLLPLEGEHGYRRSIPKSGCGKARGR
jgi:hypothetical protein